MSIDLKKVFDLKRNVFIEACAGAGKTWLLSKRYAAIMDEFARMHHENPQLPRYDASNILVITFTRKAAAEMSDRIYSDLNQLLNDKPLEHVPDTFGVNLRQASQSSKMHFRSTYSKNAISTVDAFCAQILRDQAERLNIDPEFRIQDEADTQRMELETWEGFFREQSRKANENLKVLLDHLSIYHLNEYVKKLQSHSQLMSHWLEYHASHTPQELQQEFLSENPIQDTIKAIVQLLPKLVEGLPEPSDMVNPENVFYKSLKNLSTKLNERTGDEYTKTLELLEYVKKFTLTSKQEKYLAQIRISNGVWTPEWKSEISTRLKRFLSEVVDSIAYEKLVALPGPWDLDACVIHHHLARFFKSYWDVLSQRLKREGVLSFDEVILQARQVLEDPEVAAHYSRRFPHILFDEFQDTNDLRWDIVRLIAQAGTTEIREQGLFIVGDTKQSIYRFNQADVQVMNRVRSIIADKRGWILSADETYRSSRHYVDSVINPIMSFSFPEASDQENIELYETIFRETSAAKSSPITPEEQEISRCTLNVVLDNEQSQGYPIDIMKTAELAEEWLTWIEKKGIDTRKGPAIGILLRSFTHILDYIRIFTARGLEFEVLSSKGLFEQQESYDIYHLLSVLVNPLDDLALVGLLRSPFFVLPDSEIQGLRELAGDRERGGWVWNSLSQAHPEIIETLRGWQQETAREPVDRLITRLLSEDERRLAWLSETGGNLRLANLDRLIHMIHQRSLDGLGIREIQEYFKYQIQHGDDSQAEIPGSAKIQILTIHKAKGLEFPVVLLPGMQSSSPAEKSGLFLGRQGDAWQAGITLDSHTSSHATRLFDEIKSQVKAEEEAEDLRLFYVAVTRARFGISFIARINGARQPASSTRWKRYLNPVFDLQLDKELALNEPQTLQKEWQERSTEELVYDITPGSDLIVSTNQNTSSVVQGLTPPVDNSHQLIYEEISPHTIMTWMDQKSYSGSDERQLGDDLGLETTALTFGRLLHRAMEMEWFDIEKYSKEIKLFLEDEGIVDPEGQNPFLDDLRHCLDIYRRSELDQKVATLPSANKLPELPVFGYLKSSSRVYKVSGIIDLLYQEGQDWIVLDYKTDKELPDESKLKQHAYWYQIQTYLWILKSLYGIHARGELYFNRFDKIINIPYDEEAYFQGLSSVSHGKGLQPFLPVKHPPTEALHSILKRLDSSEEVVVIEPTKNSGERLAQSLASVNLNHPRLQIVTLGEFRKLTEQGGRRLTPYLTRLAVAQLMGKRPQWGVVNRLAEAFYKATQGEAVVTSKQELFATFLEWCDTHGIQVPGRNTELSVLSKAMKVIVNSIHSTSPSDYIFLQNLALQNDLVFIDPLKEGKAQAGFQMSIAAWSSQEEMPANDTKHTYTSCFSIYEEVLLTASRVKNLINRGVDPSNIQIAVSSMERYVPSIKRVFDQVGISVRLSKREPVMERPVTQLAFALIQGRLSRQLSWDLAMTVWLHPLVIPSGSEGYLRLRLDIEMRKIGLTLFDESLPDKIDHPKLQKTAADLVKFATEQWQVGQPSPLIDGADWLMELLKSFNFTNRLDAGSVASKSYTSLKNAILGIRNDWERYLTRKGSFSDLKRELKERLKGVEVASAQQGFGVDVISLLDTLNLKDGNLFVLGMTEGQFPLTTDSNPYLKPALLNPWFLNLYLFRQWLNRPTGKIEFTSPRHTVDGAVLQESTFCQYLTKVEYPHLEAISQDQQFDQLIGKRLADPQSSRQMRHNELLAHPGRGSWYGKLNPHDMKTFDQVSASAFDELIKCPQRYWYSRKLKLEPAETNIADQQEIEVGNLVHKTLEIFGKKGGSLIAINDLQKAYSLLESVARELLKAKKIELDADLIQNKWGELYFRNFHDPQKNLLSALLSEELSVLTKFEVEGLHEQAFGDTRDKDSWDAFTIEEQEIKLTLRGKIDRVMIRGDHVWATDYKTGGVDIRDSREFWTSQMLFYYLVLKSRFPEKNVVLTYEQVKGFRDNALGIKGYLGDLDSDNPVLDTLSKKSRATVRIGSCETWSSERIKSETLAYAQPLVENEFPLTTRDEKRACAYCPFERICRKTALPR